MYFSDDRLEAACAATYKLQVSNDGTTWTEPSVVIEVRSLGRGSTGKLRQPSFVGVRRDLEPADLEEVTDA